MSKLEWRGWVLDGQLVLEPKRVRLTKGEAAVLAALLEFRLKVTGKVGKPVYMKSNDLVAASHQRSTGALRSRISTLRIAIGQAAIHRVRNEGYTLRPVEDRYGTAKHPVDELIEHLEGSLAAAKRIKESIKERLY